MAHIPLPPIKQDWYEENRKRFDADSTGVNIKELLSQKCNHFFFRKSFSEVECKYCHIGYIDNNHIFIKNGKLSEIL